MCSPDGTLKLLQLRLQPLSLVEGFPELFDSESLNLRDNGPRNPVGQVSSFSPTYPLEPYQVT